MNPSGLTLSLLLLTLPCVALAGSGDQPTKVHDELARLLIEDSKAVLKSGNAVAPLASSAPKLEVPSLDGLPAPGSSKDLTTLWLEFTDTGILSSYHGKEVTRELTFGPCTDGELLNQRFFW